MAFGVIAGVGAATSLAGSFMGAQSAQNAAKAQEEAANNYNKFLQGQQQKALALVNNPADMAAYDQALHAQEQVVQKQQALAESLSPNLIDIGKQLHGLLNGQSAPVLDNLKNQRALQRQQLVERMNQQMGPGGQTSSAGIQALNQFDTETSNVLSQAQNDYTKQFMSASLDSPQVMNALGGANKDLVSMTANSPGQRQANILMGFTGAQSQAAEMQQQAAGAGSVSGQLMGQGLSQLGQAGIMAGALHYGKSSMDKGTAGTLGGDLSQDPSLVADANSAQKFQALPSGHNQYVADVNDAMRTSPKVGIDRNQFWSQFQNQQPAQNYSGDRR